VLGAPCKARWVWAVAVAKYLFWPRAIAVRQSRQRRGAVAAGEQQHGICAAGQSKYYPFHVNSGNLILAVMYLRRVRVVGRCFVAAPTRISTIVTPLVPAAQNLCGNFVFFYKNSKSGLK
jgi:hypothetical protein